VPARWAADVTMDPPGADAAADGARSAGAGGGTDGGGSGSSGGGGAHKRSGTTTPGRLTAISPALAPAMRRMSHDASSDTGALFGFDIGGSLAKLVLFVPVDSTNKLKLAADHLASVRCAASLCVARAR
jgi:hypothetical protein